MRDPPGQPGTRVQVGGPAPPLDGDREQLARLDEVRDRGLGLLRAQPEVVAQAGLAWPRRSGRGREPHQLAHRRVGSGVGGGRDRRGSTRSGDGVAPLELLGAARAGDLARPEQELDGALGARPVPAPAGAFPRRLVLQRGSISPAVSGPWPPPPTGRRRAGACRPRPAPCHPRPRRAPAPSGSATAGGSRARRTTPRAPSTRRGGAAGGGRAVEQRTVVGTEPAEDRHVVAAAEDVDAVDLQDGHPVDQALQVPGGHRARRPGRREALRREGDAARLGARQPLGHGREVAQLTLSRMTP